ncbi:PREDICTED: uncharacterized protein LOC105450255 [Wasmannia auropunctata]|uniref:uncharacterized protein LOC105450255 n=1 Tax=Wasmannia auropunctata TaxID=64793 RepID=UPI0005EE950C|nr:PREDICTED: uncharacterized protein LOC105450255 [Wasmannia auropunctata]
MQERECDIACVSEPYRVPRDPRWIGFTEATPMAAITWQGPKPPKSMVVIGRGEGFVAVIWDGLVVVSGYFSPNKSVNQFRAFLSAIRDAIIAHRGRPMLIVGDFNARSHLWENTHPTVRGEVMADWAGALDLRLLNVFDIPTCVRPQGRSVIDLSWASPAALPSIRNWEIATEEESLSDHRYVFLDLGRGNGLRDIGGTLKKFPRWNLKSLDVDRLRACVATRLWPRLDDSLGAEGLAERIQSTFTEASSVAMRRSGNHRKRPVYWWNSEISELRAECVRLQRQVTRGRRRHRTAVPPLEAELARARGILRKAIRDAKNKAWLGLLAEVDGDPWGRPFRIVLGKMTTTSTVEAGELTNRPRLPVLWDEDCAVTVGEVEWAASKLRQTGKAPGPDGIWGGGN